MIPDRLQDFLEHFWNDQNWIWNLGPSIYHKNISNNTRNIWNHLLKNIVFFISQLSGTSEISLTSTQWTQFVFSLGTYPPQKWYYLACLKDFFQNTYRKILKRPSIWTTCKTISTSYWIKKYSSTSHQSFAQELKFAWILGIYGNQIFGFVCPRGFLVFSTHCS